MKVLQFVSDKHRETPVDVFVFEPFDFTVEYERAYASVVKLAGEDPVKVRYVAVPALIELKTDAGRAQDLNDVQHLRWIEEERTRG